MAQTDAWAVRRQHDRRQSSTVGFPRQHQQMRAELATGHQAFLAIEVARVAVKRRLHIGPVVA